MELHTFKERLHLYISRAFFVISCIFLFTYGKVAMANNEVKSLAVSQQSTTVSGTIVDENDIGLPGVNVIVKGTTIGAVTNIDGEFSIDIPNFTNNTVLVFSFLGYMTVEQTVANQRVLNISMQEDATQIDEVVVTALGIVKKEKSLTYSTQIIDGQELVRAKDPNMMNSLVGKTAGVQIIKSASGLGGSVKVNIRGSRSISSDNQPLYVIDGIPMYSSAKNAIETTLTGVNDAPNRDGGDGISNLNPDDIESMNILKGPAAAALYGSSAANGVIVISTKKGKAGRTSITFNSNTTMDNATYGIPEFQNSYTGFSTSWGSKLEGNRRYNYTKDFFKTGLTTINSVALSTGSEVMQTYFSYANTLGKGVIEGNKLGKHNFNFRETANFFDKKLAIDANINVMYQIMHNRTTPGGFYLNPLVGLYRFPRGGVENGESFTYYKENYKIFDSGRNMYTQNWYPGGISHLEQSPFWLSNMLPSLDTRARAILNLGLTYKFTDYLSLQLRGNADYVADRFNLKMYAGTTPGLASSTGRYLFNEDNNLIAYGDLLLTFQKQIKGFSISTTIGSSIKDNKHNGHGLDTYPAPMYNTNVFTITNMNLNAGRIEETNDHSQERSVFFAGQVGFQDWLFLDFTARNDWTSSMAYTNNESNGFFYPSVGLTWLLNGALKLPDWVSLGKIRGAWSKVGSGLPLYVSNPLNSIGLGGNIIYNTSRPFSELKPEMTSSIEFGTEWRLFDSKLEFDFTYYKTNTHDQLFSMTAPSGSKYNSYYINAGNIQNKGIEIVLSGSPVWTQDFRWKTGINYSFNRNEVIELAEDLIRVSVGKGGGTSGYSMYLTKGGSFGDLYGYTFLRDEQGNMVYDSDGIPFQDKSEQKKIGNTNPDFSLGWQNTLTYKGFSVYFLIEGRIGGDVISQTEADLDQYGVSKASGDARLNGSIGFYGTNISNVEKFYSIVGGRDGITEYYVYDASNFRLRELSIGYIFPQKLFAKTFIKDISLSVVGRNLFFLFNNAPYDPDAALSTGNGLQGVDVFGMPTNRSVGINLKINF
jgi:TonB-linked SusC/RagA family outer membrane protein